MSDHAFRKLWDLGYHRLVPIVPPGAPVSDRSSLAKRIEAGDDARGKVPGVRWPDGRWSGFDFVAHESAETDLDRWAAMGAGVGIKTGDGLALIDADTLDEANAKLIKETIERIIGHLPVRVGRYPKAGYPIRIEGAFQYCRVEFGERDDKGRLRDRVEVLYEGRQFVCDAIHPATLKPYRWYPAIPALADIPIVPAAKIHELLEALRQVLPAASALVKEGAQSAVNQDSLRAPADLIRRAVEAMPNSSDAFPTRESYLKVGYAIKSATLDEPDEGLAIYSDWCARWAEGDNDPRTVEADWRRMKPPFRVGAPLIFSLAEDTSGGAFHAAEAVAALWFSEPEKDEGLFPVLSSEFGQKIEINIAATAYDFPDPTGLPPRQLLYGSHYVRQFVSTTAAPTKVGKTSLIIAEALAMASGKPLLGVQPRGALRVWLWNGEDPLDEMRRRIAATMKHYGLERGDLLDERGVSRLFVDSGRDTEIVLATAGRDGARIVEPVEHALMSTIEANRLDVLVVDPFVSSHRVPENDNGAVDMVAKRWARIADRTGVAIELVHHVRKLNGAEVSIEDTRGASALISAARSARALARMTKPEGTRMGLDARAARRLFRFADAQSNLALPGDAEDEWLELRSVGLGNGHPPSGVGAAGEAGGSGGPVDADWAGRGDSVGVVALWEGGDRLAGGAEVSGATDDRMARALALVRAGTWRKDIRAGDAWIGTPIAQAYQLDLDDPADKGKARSIVSSWVRSGVLFEVTRDDSKRRPRTFVEVREPDNMSESVFD